MWAKVVVEGVRTTVHPGRDHIRAGLQAARQKKYEKTKNLGCHKMLAQSFACVHAAI